MSFVARCSAKGCLNTTFNSPHSFFRFPSESHRAKLWLIACHREDFFSKIDVMYKLSYRLCGEHFSADMFANKSHNRLRRNANPSIFTSFEDSHQSEILSCPPSNNNRILFSDLNSTNISSASGESSAVSSPSVHSDSMQRPPSVIRTMNHLGEGTPRKFKLRKVIKKLPNDKRTQHKKIGKFLKNDCTDYLEKVTLDDYIRLTYKFCRSGDLAKFITTQVSEWEKAKRS